MASRGFSLNSAVSRSVWRLSRLQWREARIIAARLESPLPAYANWTLGLLPRKVVELGIVDPVRYETVRRTLKKPG